MERHVLLMLSCQEPPHPVTEIEWHVEQCQTAGSTWVVTTRVLTGLTPGESKVAFYGDAELGNTLLGVGVFLQYLRLGEGGQAHVDASALYAEHGVPDGARGVIRVRDLQREAHGAQINSLNGIIVSMGAIDGLPLTTDNLPDSAARLQVYFRDA